MAESSSITKFGNRFATFRVALKNAEQGGGMVFPMTRNTYYLQPGDIMMWTNMDSARQEDTSALHGDCPVLKGEKIVANLRLREHGQYLLASTFPGGFFDYEMLFRPHLTKRRMTRLIENGFAEYDDDTVNISEY
ncbi:hypothetical protein GCK32_005822 [Trichostrongylus colubriformis]|uniref:Prolyl 4-hydroxylase alpha subunit Fe(2+) 2OG dioxygenase domain-containing protein n=1 Tax=Trichostrongylus colubriformis TaxID=6319 RepID=A0AAN8IWK2_TRICO